MTVNLAAQLFSSSVADAIKFCHQGLKLKNVSGSAATVHFLRTVDAAFDIRNSHNPPGKGFKAPLKPATKDCAEAALNQTEAMLCGLIQHQQQSVLREELTWSWWKWIYLKLLFLTSQMSTASLNSKRLQ